MSPLEALAEVALAAVPGDAAIAIVDPLGECLALARRGAWTSAAAEARHATLPPLARAHTAADALWLRDLLASLAPQLGGACPVRGLRTAAFELVVSGALEDLWLVAAARRGPEATVAGGGRRQARALAALAAALVEAGLAEPR